MRIITCVLLSLALAGSCLAGAALADKAANQDAGKAPLHVIQDAERMLLEGRDIFSFTSSEIYAARLAQGLDDKEAVGAIGFGDDFDEGAYGFHIPLDGCQVLTLTVGSEPPDESLAGLMFAEIAQRMDCPVVSVHVDGAGVAGPFGIEVGMTVEEVTAKPLDFLRLPVSDDWDFGYDTLFLLSYRDDQAQDGGDGICKLEVYAKDGAVTGYYVARDGLHEFFR